MGTDPPSFTHSPIDRPTPAQSRETRDCGGRLCSPRQAVLISLAVMAACAVSYLFFDIPVARFCATMDNRIKEVFGLITRLGMSTPYLVAASAGFVYFKFIKKEPSLAGAAAFLFAAVALSGLANDLVKVLVGRSRPGLLLSQGVYGFKPFVRAYDYGSFPSGHANTIAALCYGLNILSASLLRPSVRHSVPIGQAYPKCRTECRTEGERQKVKSKKFFPFYFLLLTSAALAVMASRVILGAHFPSDVLFGAYLGVLVTELLRRICRLRMPET